MNIHSGQHSCAEYPRMTDKNDDELPATRGALQKYKTMLEKCLREYEGLDRGLAALRFQLEERQQLESKIESLEENLRLTNGVLGRTQALLLTERNNCQQMALHIDLLRKQHELDREKLDLLLSLNGKPVPNHFFQGELVLKQHIAKMDKLMKEQASKLLDERSLLKEEWEKERRINEKCKKELKQRIQDLKEKLLLANDYRMQRSQKHIQDFLSGKTVDDFNYLFDHSSTPSARGTRVEHCTDQEIKRLRKKVVELEKETESYHKKLTAQNNMVQEIKDESQKRADKFQTQTKSMKEMMERLKEENNQLNKRRLIEGSGFRNEVKLLKDQLDRTQRQLCFLTLRKCEG